MRSLIRKREKISTLFHRDRFLFWSTRGLQMNTELGFDALFVVDLLDTHEGVVSRALGDCTGDHDLFDQLQLKGTYRVQSVDQVVGVAVGGGVPQGAKRIERLDSLLRLIGRIHALGFV